MVMFKIPIDKDSLVNRWKEYEQWWCDRFNDEPDYHIDILPDGLHDAADAVRFRLMGVDECEPENKHKSEFKLDFCYGAVAEDSGLELFFEFDSVDHRVTARAFMDEDYADEDSRPSLAVSYSPKYGKTLHVGLLVTLADVRFVELLFAQALSRMGFTPESPFDFDSVCEYVKKQEELDMRTKAIWEELSDWKHKVSATWDHRFTTKFDR